MTTPVIHVAEIDSTNGEAMRRAQAGEPAPVWIVAERQTAGRGRSGRTWVSEPGNFSGSLMIRPAAPASALAQLSLVTGVAIVDAVRAAADAPQHAEISSFQGLPPHPALRASLGSLRLKWPNDLLIGTAKAGGVLVESSSASGGRGHIAVIGVGVNLARPPATLPNATSLADHGVSARPRDFFPHLDDAMRTWLHVWNDSSGFVAIRRAWLARAGAAGDRMTVHAGDEVVAGRFAGLDRDGALLIDTDAGRRRMTFGDVKLHPPGVPTQTA